MNIIGIPPEQLAAAWPLVSVGIDRCLKQGLGLWDADDIYQKVDQGHWLMFACMADSTPLATIVAAIKDGKQRVLEVGFCWGKEVDTWMPEFEAAIYKIGKQAGCHVVTFNGRPGWRKLARVHDFKINSVTYMKVID
jgi:hypothetical protein